MSLVDDDKQTVGAFGAALKRYRAARRMSQLDLALSCDVSARHVSFLETGRAQPSRDMVLQLSAGLLLPLGARNALLQAAGFAPVFPASPLDSAALQPFRAILEEMMARHTPNPAMLCDRHWTIRNANPTAQALLGALHSGEGEMNAIRLLTESPLAAEIIVNLPDVIEEMHGRLQLEALEAGTDPILVEMIAGLDAARSRHPVTASRPRQPILPLILKTPLGELSFLSTVAHFGTSEDVTIRDLRLELLFPADDATREAIAALAGP